MDWFLYDNGLRRERVKVLKSDRFQVSKNEFLEFSLERAIKQSLWSSIEMRNKIIFPFLLKLSLP